MWAYKETPISEFCKISLDMYFFLWGLIIIHLWSGWSCCFVYLRRKRSAIYRAGTHMFLMPFIGTTLKIEFILFYLFLAWETYYFCYWFSWWIVCKALEKDLRNFLMDIWLNEIMWHGCSCVFVFLIDLLCYKSRLLAWVNDCFIL